MKHILSCVFLTAGAYNYCAMAAEKAENQIALAPRFNVALYNYSQADIYCQINYNKERIHISPYKLESFNIGNESMPIYVSMVPKKNIMKLVSLASSDEVALFEREIEYDFDLPVSGFLCAYQEEGPTIFLQEKEIPTFIKQMATAGKLYDLPSVTEDAIVKIRSQGSTKTPTFEYVPVKNSTQEDQKNFQWLLEETN